MLPLEVELVVYVTPKFIIWVVPDVESVQVLALEVKLTAGDAAASTLEQACVGAIW